MEKKLLKDSDLGALFEKLRAAGNRIVAPRAQGDRILFAEVATPGEMAHDCVQTTLSPKAAVFPPFEELFRYRTGQGEVSAEDVAVDARPTVLFGLRPCDAASFASLNAVFTWDYQDKFFKERMANTSVVAIACTSPDEYCFCTSVGGGPADTRGSDILLSPDGAGAYVAQILTPRGQQLVELAGGVFAPYDGPIPAPPELPTQFDLETLAAKLPALFNNEAIWQEQSMRCLGCGACAFMCPTCVCFDIQDEPGKEGGRRVRCWDSCGLSLFTLHTSGHNPRSKQSMRWRQRVMHKFSYFQERLGVLGCVGCGRCSRGCPADMNLVEHLKQLAEVAQ